MSTFSIVEVELARWPWAELRKMCGVASNVPNAIRKLLVATTADEAHEAYWMLENHVVVQGQLFQAAEFVIPVLFALLAQEPNVYAKARALELMFQIVAGTPDESEFVHGNSDLAEKCRRRAQEGLWLLYREVCVGQRAAALEILQIIDPDPSRVAEVPK